MLVPEHCENLSELLLRWEAAVHAELGYFPVGFRRSIRNHVNAYLSKLQEDLEVELRAVTTARKAMALDRSEDDATCTTSSAREAPSGLMRIAMRVETER